MAANPVEFPSTLQLDVQTISPGAALIACSGRLTSDTAPDFKKQVKELIPQNRRIVLNLTKLNYMDSSGLGSLVSVYVTARAAHCELKLINLSARIQQLLRLTNLASVFEPYGEYL